jgi:hypothetical protein
MRRRLAVASSAVVAGCALGDPQPSATWEVTDNSAVLHWDVYSSFAGDTEYWWKYGTTSAYESESAHGTVAIADDQPHPVSAEITDLTAATTYHFQRRGGEPPRGQLLERPHVHDRSRTRRLAACVRVGPRQQQQRHLRGRFERQPPVNLTDGTDLEATPTCSAKRPLPNYPGGKSRVFLAAR